jgi:hypothetical protein
VFIASSERGDTIQWRRADGTGAAEHLVDARAAEGWMPGGRSTRAIPSTAVEPVALPIKGFVQAEYRRQFELLPNGREFLMLFSLSGQ